MKQDSRKYAEELKELGVTEPGFKTPTNYFEELSKNIFHKIEESSLPESTGFNVPNDYFQDFEKSILKKIKTSKKNTTKTKVWYVFSSIAAVLIVYFGVLNYNQSAKISFDSVSVNDIQDYIDHGNMNIDSYVIASTNQDIDLAGMIHDLVSENEINSYLDTQNSEFLFLEN